MKLLSHAELADKGIRYTPVHLWRLARAGKFPRPVKLGAGPTARNAWPEDEIDRWIADRIAERDEAAAAA